MVGFLISNYRNQFSKRSERDFFDPFCFSLDMIFPTCRLFLARRHSFARNFRWSVGRDIAAFALQHTTFHHPTSNLLKISLCSMGVGGWPLGYEERRCWANCPADSFQNFHPYAILIHQRHCRQTDRQTDDMQSQDRALHYSASRGKNSNGPGGYWSGHEKRLCMGLQLLDPSTLRQAFYMHNIYCFNSRTGRPIYCVVFCSIQQNVGRTDTTGTITTLHRQMPLQYRHSLDLFICTVYYEHCPCIAIRLACMHIRYRTARTVGYVCPKLSDSSSSAFKLFRFYHFRR